jgi:hypothetical protein
VIEEMLTITQNSLESENFKKNVMILIVVISFFCFIALMNILWIKLIMMPLVIGGVTLASKKWGNAVGGIIASLPWIAGPIMLFFTLEQGVDFTVSSIKGIIYLFIYQISVVCEFIVSVFRLFINYFIAKYHSILHEFDCLVYYIGHLMFDWY